MAAPIRRTVLAAVLTALLSGCGSGIVAIFSDDGGSSGVPPPAPSLASNPRLAPLQPEEFILWEAKVDNAELPSRLDRIAVEIRALGVVDEQRLVRQLDASTVQFLFTTNNIRAAALQTYGPAALQEHDVVSHLAMLIDGVEVAPPVEVLLLRQPHVEIANNPALKTLSALGETLELRLRSISLRLPPGLDPGAAGYTTQLVQLNNLVPRVAFGQNLSEQVSIEVLSARPGAPGELMLSVAMPPVDRPNQAHLTVNSLPSGRSTLVSNMFYRPEILGASPGSGPSGGGTKLFLFGRALVPTSGTSEVLDFDNVEISIRKGGREIQIPTGNLQKDGSTSSLLVFSMPASPDGSSGPADVRLRATVFALGGEAFVVDSEAIGVFSYGDSYPYFGPRGATLGSEFQAVRFSPFVDTRSPAVDAIGVSSGPAGMPFAAVIQSRGNGLFSPFGPAVRAGVTSDLFQRRPVDICIDDFIGNGTRSAVILNTGPVGSEVARHGFILGRATTNPPLVFNENFQLEYENPGRVCASGDLNQDGVADLVIVPGPGGRPQVPLVFTSTQPSSTFLRTELRLNEPGETDFEAVALADVDDDGLLDLLLGQGGTEPRLLVWFGDGIGGFSNSDAVDLKGESLDLSKAGYTVDVGSRAVGLHAVGPKSNRTLVMVLSGVPGSTSSPPAVLHFVRGSMVRDFLAPTTANLLKFAGGVRGFVASASGDLSGDGADELIVASGGDDADPLRVFVRGSSMELVYEEAAVDYGAEQLEGVRRVDIGMAVAPGRHQQVGGRRAVFVTHDQDLLTGREHRISAFLVDPRSAQPRLLSPAAARRIPEPITGVALGEFFPRPPILALPEYLDAWIAVEGGLLLAKNDGLGDLDVGSQVLPAAQILGSTLTSVRGLRGGSPGSALSMPAFLTSDGRLGVVLDTSVQSVSYAGEGAPVDLRSFAPFDSNPSLNLRTRSLQSTSTILSADVDQDGISDLIVMLGLASAPGAGVEGESLLLLLRGKASPAVGEFPFSLPSGSGVARSVTHGNVSSLVAGDFATSAGNTLELAVTLPQGGYLQNEVRFYRWDAAESRFLQSYVSPNQPALSVGDEPSAVVAADFDGDGRTDLAVASRADHNLWVIYNQSPPTSGRDVDLSRFVSAPANPLVLPAGQPRRMFAEDLNGDGLPDVTLMIETGTLLREHDVAYYLSPGSLSGSVVRFAQSQRTGSQILNGGAWIPRNATASASLGDLNGDGAPDLIVGWKTAGPSDYNLRVLFGNNL